VRLRTLGDTFLSWLGPRNAPEMQVGFFEIAIPALATSSTEAKLELIAWFEIISRTKPEVRAMFEQYGDDPVCRLVPSDFTTTSTRAGS